MLTMSLHLVALQYTGREIIEINENPSKNFLVSSGESNDDENKNRKRKFVWN